MDQTLGRAVAFIAVHGIEKLRGKDGLVPCGFGILLLIGTEQRRLWGAAFLKDTQDCFALAMCLVFNEMSGIAAERAEDCFPENVDFRVQNDGFRQKFGEILDANANQGLTKSRKPYNNYAPWNEAYALFSQSDSTLRKIGNTTDAENLEIARKLAVQGAGIAAQNISATLPGLFCQGEVALEAPEL